LIKLTVMTPTWGNTTPDRADARADDLAQCCAGRQDDDAQQRFSEGAVTLGQRDNLSQAVLTVSVACVFDRRIHEVRELDIAPAARHGRYPALCGQVITAASMAEPGVRRCPDCAELREDDVPRRPVGLLRRIVGR
jgi:hypothetical protein